MSFCLTIETNLAYIVHLLTSPIEFTFHFHESQYFVIKTHMGQNTKSVHCETKIVLQIRLENLNF